MTVTSRTASTSGVAGQAATRTRGGRWRDPYLAVVAVVMLWAVLVTLRHAWAGDFRLHLATVHALAADPWTPSDPLVGAVSGSPYYSPYTLTLGLVAAVTGLHPEHVLELMGLVNLALLLIAFRRFCRHLGGGPLVAALAVVATLLLWGMHPVEWSGFLGLYSLSWTLGYPSVIATALMLFTWDAFLRHRAAASWRGIAVIVALGVLLVLIHPFTAANTVIGLVAFALADPRALARGRLAVEYAVAAVVIFLLAMLWPWSDFFSLFGAAGDLDGAHRTLMTDMVGEFGFKHYGLALVGLPALVTGGRRPLGRELQILFVLAVSAVALGAITGSYGLARCIPVAMLPLHLALASYLGGRAAGLRPVRVAYAAVALVVCCVGLYGESGGVIRAYWRDVPARTLEDWGTRPVTTSYDRLLPYVRPGDVVIGDGTWPGRLVNGRGARSVVPGWPYPFVDEAGRRRDTAEFFAASTSPPRRVAIADRYGVTCALVDRDQDFLLGPADLPGFRQKGPRSGGHVLLCRR